MDQMEMQHFCLKWDNHQTNLLEGFVDLLNKEQLCDVTIACDGISLKAHKLVLSASSAFFQNIFLKNPCNHPIIIIPDLKYVDMKALIDFIYCGQVNISQNQLSSILKAAAYLKIKGLSDYIAQNKMLSNDSFSNILGTSNSLATNSENNSEKPKSSDINTLIEEGDLHLTDENLCSTENVPYSIHSEDDQDKKSITAKHEVQTEEANCSDSSNDLHVPMEINPSSLMEQSMITENILQVKSVDNEIFSNDLINCDSELEEREASNLELTGQIDHSDVHYNLDVQCFKESLNSGLVTDKSLLKLPLMCSSCKYLMTSLSDAQSHLNTNPNCRTSQFKCSLCPKIFIWPATLVKHFREQHQGPGGTTRVTERLWYFCDVCKKPLLSKHALTLHKNKFHGQLIDSFHPASPESSNPAKRGRKQGTRVCRLCKRTFLSNVDYQTHMQSFHSSNNDLKFMPGSTTESRGLLTVTENESNSSQSSMSISSIT